MSLPRRPSLPRKPARGGGRKPVEPLGLPEIGKSNPLKDEFGLAWSWVEGMGTTQREWLSLAYAELGFDKNIPPSRQGSYGSSGTIPEMVFLGGLLSVGKRYMEDYEFQSEALGGRRFPGGAVLDFLVYTNGLRVGVPVESVFHASDFVFAGMGKVREDDAQRIRLLSHGIVDRLVIVNRTSDGYPLENSNEALCRADLDRVLNAT